MTRRSALHRKQSANDHLEGLVHMYIGLGTLILILVVVAIIYFVRRA